jgi:hypothetical protein
LYPSDEFKDGTMAGCGLIKNLPPPSSGTKNFMFLALLAPLLIALGLRWRASHLKTASI